MDGSAIYYCICAMHISAMAGNPLNLIEQLKVAVIGALVTCGVAPIPGGFVVWIYMIMQAADIPYEGEKIQSLMAVVLTIDWFMDRCRTSINIFGDSVVAAIVDYRIYGLDPAVDLTEGQEGDGPGPLRDTVQLERMNKQNAVSNGRDGEMAEGLAAAAAPTSDGGATFVNGTQAKPGP